MWFPLVVLCTLVLEVRCKLESFPPGFQFGAASSAYQIEGSWNVSDKGESICDRYAHAHRSEVADGSDGDEACDSYRLWRSDVQCVAEMGLDFYRFSISWTRLLPTGLSNKISKDGAKYYGDLIDGLLAQGVKPVVTLYHFDLPQRLQDLGGWLNPLSSDWFADYARIAYQLYGDRVATWITLNEPMMTCHLGYGAGIIAPGVVDLDVTPYLCAKHMLIAHAKAWRIYDEEFRDQYRGKVSVTNLIFWMEPFTTDDEGHEDLVELVKQFGGGMYSHPIFSKEGGWPPLVEKLMAEKSRKEGRDVSRLPPLSDEEKHFMRGTFDFYALNYYTSRRTRMAARREAVGTWPFDGLPEFHIILEGLASPDAKGYSWFYNDPEGFRKTLNWVKQQYGDIEVVITENGYPKGSPELEDDDRVRFLQQHLEQVLLSIKEDGVNVTMYTVWSLMDNFEWVAGFTSKFGLYAVDFSSPRRPRTARHSALYYRDVISARAITVDEDNSKDNHV